MLHGLAWFFHHYRKAELLFQRNVNDSFHLIGEIKGHSLDHRRQTIKLSAIFQCCLLDLQHTLYVSPRGSKVGSVLKDKTGMIPIK